MGTEQAIAVYTTGRKKIVIESLAFIFFLGFDIFGDAIAIIETGGWLPLLIIVGIVIALDLITALYSYSIVEIYPDRVTIRRPVFGKQQAVQFSDFRTIYFNTGESLMESELSSQPKLFCAHYKDAKHRMYLAEFTVRYWLYENYPQMILDIWTRCPCKKMINRQKVEDNKIYVALGMKAPGSAAHTENLP